MAKLTICRHKRELPYKAVTSTASIYYTAQTGKLVRQGTIQISLQ
ncbi:MAG TPA: hypothetical protein VN025_12820 [Candidatus Dormibacteraeota bacterium]|nr:hypothetical protein [Candidatus Dormibacteraeota bacterium]